MQSLNRMTPGPARNPLVFSEDGVIRRYYQRCGMTRTRPSLARERETVRAYARQGQAPRGEQIEIILQQHYHYANWEIRPTKILSALALADCFFCADQIGIGFIGHFLASFTLCTQKTSIKMRVFTQIIRLARRPNLFIYNNIKRIDCQALQSLQTLTKTSCEQKENFKFRHALFTQKSRFMQLVKFPFIASMQGKLYLPLFFAFSSIYCHFGAFLWTMLLIFLIWIHPKRYGKLFLPTLSSPCKICPSKIRS